VARKMVCKTKVKGVTENEEPTKQAKC